MGEPENERRQQEDAGENHARIQPHLPTLASPDAHLRIAVSMPDSTHLGQLLLTGVPGPTLDSETAARLKKLQPGGYILFGRNIESPEQLRKLIDDLRGLSHIEPFITIDQEGGRVSRLRLIGEEPPNAQALRDKGDPKLIKTHGKLTGQLLRLFGFNLDLCPVLDISYDDTADNSLKGRCYGRDPQEVVTNAGVFNRAMRGEGILSCAKHFPGRGGTNWRFGFAARPAPATGRSGGRF